MNRFSIMAFLAITLGATSIGANHNFGFIAGKDKLSDRGRYCEFAHTQKANPVLSTYREFKMKYENLPEFLSLHLDDSESQINSRLKQIKTSMNLLTEQTQKLGRLPASTVLDWKLKTEIPGQLEQMRQEKDRLETRLTAIHERNFSELEISNTYLEAREEALSSDPLPLFGLELSLKNSIFGDEVQLKPVWIETKENELWQIKDASRKPLLSLKKSMLTADLKNAFAQKNLPASFRAYSAQAKARSLSLEEVQWKFISAQQLVLVGSPSTHLAVQAVLDLGCQQ